MSHRRAVNRTERRQTNQELHLVRRELENVPTIYTEDEVAAARAKTIESITDNWYKAFDHRLQKVETESAHHCIDLYDLIERVDELGKDVDNLQLGSASSSTTTRTPSSSSMCIRVTRKASASARFSAISRSTASLARWSPYSPPFRS
jgi:hypothetical protein